MQYNFSGFLEMLLFKLISESLALFADGSNGVVVHYVKFQNYMQYSAENTLLNMVQGNKIFTSAAVLG